MKCLSQISPSTTRMRILVIAALAVVSAVGLALLVATVTFPLLAHIPSESVHRAVGLTAFLVAVPVVIPVVMSFTRMLSKVEGHRLGLESREELFKTAQQVAKLGHWQYDVASGEVILSDVVHDLLGDPERELHITLPKLLEMTHPDDRSRLKESLERIVRDGGSAQAEYRIIGLHGLERIFWMDGGRRILDPKGNPMFAYGACQDISERRQVEAALRESEDHHRHAVELNPQISWTADPDGNILEAGPLWLEYTGTEIEEGLGSGWTAALHPEDLESTIRLWSQALKTGEPLDTEYRLRTSDGSYRWFRARAAARRDRSGRIVRWYGTLEDIHDRNLVRAALQDSEAFARSILDSTPDAVKVLDLHGVLEFANEPGLTKTRTSSLKSVRGKRWESLWPEEAREDIVHAVAAARAGETAKFSGYCPTSEGENRWWNVSVSPIPGRDGHPGRLLAISRDMTSAKRAQVELEAAKAAAEKAVARLENVLSSTTDCIITLDRELRFTYLNRHAQRLIAPDRDLLGMHHSEPFPELANSVLQHRYETALTSQRPDQFEAHIPVHDLWLDVHVYPSADGVSVFFKDVTERYRSREQLLHLAQYDALTELVNRTVLREQLDRALSIAEADNQTAFLFLDLDDFKSVNDSLGHPAGDRVLMEVGKRLQACIQDSDIAARFGGDEFAVLLSRVTDVSEATALANGIITALGFPYDIDGRAVNVGVSVGIAIASQPGAEADEVIRNADIALYEAKAKGGGAYRIFESEMGERFDDWQELKQDLRGALGRGELGLHYQPLTNLRTGSITGFEALLRWNHPTRGVVSPAVFIPLAEQTGLIADIGAWVLHEACNEAASWPDEVSIAVNLSPVQFRSGDLPDCVSRCLTESGLSPARLQIEVTESVLLEDDEENIEVLHALHRIGTQISMDDFGTGYSSLSYLRSFPFDKLKIDRSFVRELNGDDEGSRQSLVIITAVVNLARQMGLKTTAEGIETEGQLEALRAIMCDEGQGFLFSKPVSAQEASEMILGRDGDRQALSPRTSRWLEEPASARGGHVVVPFPNANQGSRSSGA